MCDLATNWSCKSTSSRNQVPTSGVAFNITGNKNDRNAGDKGQKMSVNVKDAKPKRKVDCWNCGGNHLARDCKKHAKKEGDTERKVNATFRDNDDDDHGDEVILTCF